MQAINYYICQSNQIMVYNIDKKSIAMWNKLCHIFENRPILSESMLLFIYGTEDVKREEIMKILPLLCYRFWNGN